MTQPPPQPGQYPQQPMPQGQPMYAPVPPTNTLAIISMIAAIVGLFTFAILSLAGVIMGHIALNQIKKRAEGGRGMAITGLILGYVGIAFWILFLIIAVAALGLLGTAGAAGAFS